MALAQNEPQMGDFFNETLAAIELQRQISLDTPIEKRKWEADEDFRLLVAVDKYGVHSWKKIALDVETRDAGQCLNRYTRYLRPGIIKGPWSEDEDLALIYVLAEGHKSWSEVASQLGTRSSKQCRERWLNHLHPSINSSEFTALEDELLVRQHSQLGNKWAELARCLPGRTETSVKARFMLLSRRKKQKNRESAPKKRRKMEGTTSNPIFEASSAGASASSDTVPDF